MKTERTGDASLAVSFDGEAPSEPDGEGGECVCGGLGGGCTTHYANVVTNVK